MLTPTFTSIRRRLKPGDIEPFHLSHPSAIDAARLEPRVLFSAAPFDATLDQIDLDQIDLDQIDHDQIDHDQIDPDVTNDVDATLFESDVDFKDSDSFDSFFVVDPSDSSEQLIRIDQAAVPASLERKELVFLDGHVPELEKLLIDLRDGGIKERDFDVILLDGRSNGVQQISDTLANYDNVSAIHLLSHGSEGQVRLGNTTLSQANFNIYENQIARWNESLSQDADILIYGCDLASNQQGRTLVESLTDACNCDVAASMDDTGHSSLGGDWHLEYATGVIETDVAISVEVQQAWGGLLAVETLRDEFNSVSYAGSDGSVAWSNDWQEIFEVNGPGSGLVSVSTEAGEQGLVLKSWGIGAWREADLSSATSAFLAFDYARISLEDPSEYVVLEVSANGGGSWTEIDRFDGPNDDSTLLFASYDITPYIASNTQIRFASSPINGGGDRFIADNIEIMYSSAPALIVNTTTDAVDGDTASIATLLGNNPDGLISLREALEATEGTAGRDLIRFDIPGAGPHTILPTSALPDVDHPVVIDGFSEPGAWHNTLRDGNNANLQIEINGGSAGGGAEGLHVKDATSSNSIFRGLVITGFGDDGIEIDDTDSITVEGNFIHGNGANGVHINSQSSNNIIGGDKPFARNVISDNSGVGIEITGNNTDRNVIQGNYIGTDFVGMGPLGNALGGVFVKSGATDNEIGGTLPGEGNIIAFSFDPGGPADPTPGFSINDNGSDRNTIRGNSIHSNNGLGIDLNGDGVRQINDASDGDTNENDFLNHPVLTSAVTDAATKITINGDINQGLPGTAFELDFFYTVGQIDEGQYYLGTVPGATNGSGNLNFDNTQFTGVAVPVGANITVTANVVGGPENGNTSEFSPALAATGVGATPGGVFNNLGLWLKADAGITLGGGGVSQWDNQTSSGTLPNVQQGISGQQPDLISSGLNFNPVISFNNASFDDLRDTSVLGSDLFSSDQTSIFTVVRRNSGGVMLQWLESGLNRVSVEGSAPRFDFGHQTNDSVSGSGLGTGYQIINTQASPGAPDALLEIYINGALDPGAGTASVPNPFNDSATGSFRLGEYPLTGFNANMDLAELVIYSSSLTDDDRHQVESYLALKYGITLDQTTPTDYVDSVGSTIWDAAFNSIYNNDIAGIGLDAGSALDQTQSRSINSDAIVAVSAASDQQSMEFLIWGNDNAALSEVVGEPASVSDRLDRIWRVAETGEVGTTKIEFDLSGLTYSGTTATDFNLIIDTDTDFSAGETLVAAASYSAVSEIVSFNGVSLSDGEYFALGTTGRNNAPTLLDTVVALDSVAEDAGLPVGLVGTPISSLVDFIGGGGQNNVTDPDSAAITGIAITAADTTNGTWHFSTNGGSNWNPLGVVSNSSARVLAADLSTLIYFEPNLNYNGLIPAALTFRAWDQTDANANGTPGVNTGTGSGSSAFSNAVDTALLTVTPVNDPPTVAVNTGATVNEGSAANVITAAMLNEGDSDDAGTELTYTVTSVTSNGTLRLSGAAMVVGNTFTQDELDNNRITYDHDGSETLSDSFDFSLADGGEDGASPFAGTFNIAVTPINDEESLDTNIGLTLPNAATSTITTALLETTDVDSTPVQLTYTVNAAPGNGTLRLSGTPLNASDKFTQDDIDNNRITYDHGGGETTTDSFDFDVDDGLGTNSNGTFNIAVTSVNDSPTVAVNTGTTVNEGSTVNVITTAMLNEGDPDDSGTGLTYTVTSVTTNGTLRLSGVAMIVSNTFTQDDIDNNRITYDHDGSETTSDSFGFSLADGGDDGANPAVGSFDIIVVAVNDPSVVSVPGPLAPSEDMPFLITGISVADVDAGLANIQLSLVAGNGNLTVDPNVVGGVPAAGIAGNGTSLVVVTGSVSQINTTLASGSGLVYLGHLNFNGADSLLVKANDLGNTGTGSAGVDSQGILLNVAAVNDRPQGVNDTFSIIGATSLTVGPSGVLSNDYDIEGSALTASLLSVPSNGTVTLNADGSFTYIAFSGFDSGTDSFTYFASDGSAISDPTTVSISLSNIVLPPVIPPKVEPPPDLVDDELDPPLTTPPAGNTPPIKVSAKPPIHDPDRTASLPLTLPDLELARTSTLGMEELQTRFISPPTVGVAQEVSPQDRAFPSLTEQSLIWDGLERLNEEFYASAELPDFMVGSVAGLASTFSVGYVIFLLRGGSLLAGMLAQLPAWHLIDPLPVFAGLGFSDEEEGDESLQTMLEKADERHQSHPVDGQELG